jgi:hypothetical protein
VRSIVVVLAVALSILACGPIRPPHDARLAALAREPLEYGDQCAEARRSANDSVPPPGYTPPRAVQIPLPPMPVPEAMRRKTAVITMRVDSVGLQVPSTLTISGLPQHEYLTRMRHALGGVQFYPAHIGKCAVAGTYEMRIEL